MPKRVGQLSALFRGVPRAATNGERVFPPRGHWVTFVVGADARGGNRVVPPASE